MRKSSFFNEQDYDAALIAAIDGLGDEEDQNLQNIIKALEAGADPLKKGKLNTALTAAIVLRKVDLIEFILKKYPAGHPIFSEHDTFIGNTPLSLAIKSGQYDLAEKLIEKKCDVNCKIGHEPFHIYPLHLCAFLLGTSGDEKQEASLVKIIKLIIEKGANTNEILHWGQTPRDVLMMNIQKEDFDLYKDDRSYFRYYLGNPFSDEDVTFGEIMLDVRKDIATVEETIRNHEDQGADITADVKALKDLQEELQGYETDHPLIAKEVQTFVEFMKMMDEFRMETMATAEELEAFANKCAEENPQFEKMAKYNSRTDVYSLQELRQKFNEQIPAGFHIKQGTSVTNAWYPYLPYAFVEHCVWHRPGFNRETVTETRNAFFATETGKEVRDELRNIMEPISHTLE